MRALLLALLLVPLAGCAEIGHDERHMFGGRIVTDATEPELQELYARIRAAGGTVDITAGLPTSRFGGRNLAPDDCRALREWAASRRYVAEASACRMEPNAE